MAEKKKPDVLLIGVLDCRATDNDDPAEDPRFGKVGRQTVQDSGPLIRKRTETIEDDLLARWLDFIDRAHAAEKPFLLSHNTTRMHVWTRRSKRWHDKIKFGHYAEGGRSSTGLWANRAPGSTRSAFISTVTTSFPTSPAAVASPRKLNSSPQRASSVCHLLPGLEGPFPSQGRLV
jgi:hypothetical protein